MRRLQVFWTKLVWMWLWTWERSTVIQDINDLQHPTMHCTLVTAFTLKWINSVQVLWTDHVTRCFRSTWTDHQSGLCRRCEEEVQSSDRHTYVGHAPHQWRRSLRWDTPALQVYRCVTQVRSFKQQHKNTRQHSAHRQAEHIIHTDGYCRNHSNQRVDI